MARAAWEVRNPPNERKRRKREADLRQRQGRAPLIDEDHEPELFDDLQGIWCAWQQLLGDRGGMGESIPWSAMSRWCEDNGIHGAERLRWCRLIRATDLSSLAEQAKRR